MGKRLTITELRNLAQRAADAARLRAAMGDYDTKDYDLGRQDAWRMILEALDGLPARLRLAAGD